MTIRAIVARAAPDRLARHGPYSEFIPHDRYVPVKLNEYTQRRLDDGDIELKPGTDVIETTVFPFDPDAYPEPTPAPAPAPASTKKKS